MLAFQTIVRDYLELDNRTRYEREMRRWIADSAVASAVLGSRSSWRMHQAGQAPADRRARS